MNSRLTVSDVQLAIGSLFNADDFLPYLNQAMESLINGGRWKGNLLYVSFDSSTGYITLPYEYSSIMGIDISKVPATVFSQFHRFIESGPGRVDDTDPTTGYLMDMGDGHPSLVDIPTDGSTLRITISNAVDAGKVVRCFGTVGGAPIFDANGLGFDITTANPTVNSAVTIDSLTGIEMPITATGAPSFSYSIALYSVAPDTTATLLSTYYPPDIRPNYRRYQTGVVTAPSDGTPAINCLCQRRFIPVYKLTDKVYPDSMRAIKAAMQAVQCEDAANYDQAATFWNVAYDTLNRIVHSSRGAAKPEFNFLPLGTTNPFPNVN